MRAVSVGTKVPNKLLWWEGVVEASECWCTRAKRSLCGSLPGAAQHDAGFRAQLQAISDVDSGGAKPRGNSSETLTAFNLRMRRPLRDACRGGSFCGSMHQDTFASITSSDAFFRDATGHYKRSLLSAKRVPFDATPAHKGWPSNGFSVVKIFKGMQQVCESTLLSYYSFKEACKGRSADVNMCEAFRPGGYVGLNNDASQVSSAQSFIAKFKNSTSRAYLSRATQCPQELFRSRYAPPVTSFGRSLSTSTEKHFDEDVTEQQSSVSSQQQSSYPIQHQSPFAVQQKSLGGQQSSLGGQQSSLGGQQSSPGGQQSSLEVPDSKPVGGPSWPNPDNAASYVLMSNIYADGDRWDEVKRINEMRLKARAWKKPGKAYVEIQAKVHEFIVGDRTHQDSTNIYEKLRKIKRHMGHMGYVPYVDLVLENRSYYDPYKPR